MRNITAFRKILAPLLIVLVGAASLGAGAVAHKRAADTRGWVDATATDDLPYRLPLIGVNAELIGLDSDELARQLDLMVGAGITWVRQRFRWDLIEPEPGRFNWEPWDALVEAIGAHDGLELVAVLEGTPPWARSHLAPDEPLAPPENVVDFGEFAGELAARYADKINYYQVWDEPNLESHWGWLPPNPSEYAAMLAAAYEAIHGADPGATVIAAALAPTVEAGPRNLSDVLFLEALYDQGGGEYLDAAAGKPYGFDTGPDDRRVDPGVLNFSRIILLREVMVAHGDGRKALWGCDFGWNALPPDWDGEPSIWGEVTPELQSAYTRGAYMRAAAEWPWIGGLILYHWQPDVPLDDPRWGFSVLGPDGEPGPLYGVLADLGFGGVALPGRYPADTPYATYRGDWEIGRWGADTPELAEGAELEFTFSGGNVAVEAHRANFRGFLYVRIEDADSPGADLSNALPRTSEGDAYVVLTSDYAEPGRDTITLARHLPWEPDGPGYVVRIKPVLGWGRWTLAGFAVGYPPDTFGYDIAFGILVAVAVVAAVGFIYMRLRGGVRPAIRIPVTPVTAWIASFVTGFGAFVTLWGRATNITRGEPVGLLATILSAGVLYFSPGLIVSLVAGAVLFWMIALRPELGLALTLFWAPFFHFPIELYERALSMSEICLLMTFGAWVLRGAISLARRIRSEWGTGEGRGGVLLKVALRGADWPIVAMVVLGTASLIWAVHLREAAREWRLLIVEPALFYLMLRTMPLTRRDMLRLVHALLLAGSVVALYGLMLLGTGIYYVTAEGGFRRLSSVYGSPNNVALFLGRLIPVALAMALMARERILRIWAAVTGVVMLAAFVLTFSAGGLLLGLPAGMVTVLIFWGGKRALKWLIVVGIVGLLLLIPLSQTPRFAHLTDFSGGTVFFRLKLWESSLDMLRDHPITGIGLDQFLYLYRGHYIRPEAWQEPNLSHPHNIVLDYWLRLGILGVALGVWLQLGFWKPAVRAYRELRGQDPTVAALVLGFMGGMADFLAHGLVDNSYFLIDLAYVFITAFWIANHAPGLTDGAAASTIQPR